MILVVSTDITIVNQLKDAHQVMHCSMVDEAKTIIASGEIEAVVVGEPYININPEILEHRNVIIIKKKSDLDKLIKNKKQPHISDEFHSGIKEEPPILSRKLRPVEEKQNVDLKTLGLILLVTTNIELVKHLAEFNLQISTTEHNAIKILSRCDPKIIIWDIDEKPPDISNLLIYKWGKDLLYLDDIVQVMSNLDLSLLEK